MDIKSISRKVTGRFRANGTQPARFGTFSGVFTPDLLCILGVIMYLRLGWVVGNTGLLGALAIIVMAKAVTICTGLSMSSITTNIKIGPGGAYSIISKSLGLEAGGSIGIPFYISQTLSVSLYIVGFTSGWIRAFPSHPPILVSLLTWLLLLGISYISAHFAIKIQYVIMGIIGLSLFSFFLTPNRPIPEIPMLGSFEDGGFWATFAIFFPAVTGIMAGSNMSGELVNPRRSIPMGTLSSIGVAMIIYVALAYMSARYIPTGELQSNFTAMVDNALMPSLVLCGILAATFSSALASLVGAPRILSALAEQKTVPLSKFFSVKAANNEPRNATIFTGVIILVSILMGDLNALASLITMFFLITYGTLNLVVFLQQNMNMISFRPTFKVPKVVPLAGAASCLLIMFLINPVFSFIAIITIVFLYGWLTRRGLQADWGDIRGGMFLVLAERASRLAAKFPRHQISWKPDLLIPIDDPKVWSGSLLFIRSITHPSGSIFAFTVKDTDVEQTNTDLKELLAPLSREQILINSTVIEDGRFLHGAKMVIQTLRGGTLRPNSLFLTAGSNSQKDANIIQLAKYAAQSKLGIILLNQHPRVAFGVQKDVNIWLRDESPNWHLAMLIALQIHQNWDGRLNLITVSPDKSQKKRLYAFLEYLSDQARLPSITELCVLEGKFLEAMPDAPRADINIFGIAPEISLDLVRRIGATANSSCLFVGDSGQESVLV
ncbi:MAG: Na-K-Cl cotransporter [Acidobacteria bacterium]|nr:Na-K-Cl cotransporter [Acidobacteriota bacterium]